MNLQLQLRRMVYNEDSTWLKQVRNQHIQRASKNSRIMKRVLVKVIGPNKACKQSKCEIMASVHMVIIYIFFHNLVLKIPMIIGLKDRDYLKITEVFCLVPGG